MADSDSETNGERLVIDLDVAKRQKRLDRSGDDEAAPE